MLPGIRTFSLVRSTQVPPGLYVINARSLAKTDALDLLHAELLGYGLDVAIVIETHFKDRHKEQVCRMEDFRTFRRDRKGYQNGGVAIYVRDELPAREVQVPNMLDVLELLWVEVTTNEGPAFVGALYHPPKPIYQTCLILDALETSMEIFFRVKGDAVVALGGDFNSLDILDVSARTGLLPLVTGPTRGKNTLDMLMTSKPGLYAVKVITYPIRTDHKAIVESNDGRFTGQRLKT